MCVFMCVFATFQIGDAHAVLSDEEARAEYDDVRRDERRYGRGNRRSNPWNGGQTYHYASRGFQSNLTSGIFGTLFPILLLLGAAVFLQHFEDPQQQNGNNQQQRQVCIWHIILYHITSHHITLPSYERQ